MQLTNTNKQLKKVKIGPRPLETRQEPEHRSGPDAGGVLTNWIQPGAEK